MKELNTTIQCFVRCCPWREEPSQEHSWSWIRASHYSSRERPGYLVQAGWTHGHFGTQVNYLSNGLNHPELPWAAEELKDKGHGFSRICILRYWEFLELLEQAVPQIAWRWIWIYLYLISKKTGKAPCQGCSDFYNWTAKLRNRSGERAQGTRQAEL